MAEAMRRKLGVELQGGAIISRILRLRDEQDPGLRVPVPEEVVAQHSLAPLESQFDDLLQTFIT